MPIAAEIYYQQHEDTTDQAEPGLVFIHGAGGNHLYWPFNLRRLPGCRVYAVDLPGHGRSGGSGQPTIAGYGERIVQWLQAIHLGRVVFVGHSMGSAIALWLALEAPQQVGGLILIGAAAQLKVNPALIASAANPVSFPQVVETIIHWSFSRQAPSQLSRLATRRMLETNPSLLHSDLLACDSFNIQARLPEIHCPTLVICGAEDKMTPPNSGRSLAEHIAGASLEIIPSAGHMAMIEQPQAVEQILVEFLTVFK